MTKGKTKMEEVYYITPDDKIEIAAIRKEIDESAKEQTYDVYKVLALNFREDKYNKIKYIKNKANNLSIIKITLKSTVNVKSTPVQFEVKIVYKEGVGPCVEVTTEGHSEWFKFEILERNFINRIMLFYNESTNKWKFNIDSKKFDYLKFKA